MELCSQESLGELESCAKRGNPIEKIINDRHLQIISVPEDRLDFMSRKLRLIVVPTKKAGENTEQNYTQAIGIYKQESGPS